MPSTSTAFTRLPMISRSRSRRTTSTSGSSGILLLQLAARTQRHGSARRRRRRRVGRAVLMHAVPRRACGGLLGVLLRAPFALPEDLAAQRDGGEEALRVVGPLGAHVVARQLVEPLRRDLLEARLVVAHVG